MCPLNDDMAAILYKISPTMSLNDILLMAVEIGRIASFSSPRGPQKQKKTETPERPELLYIKCVVVLLKCKTKNKGRSTMGKPNIGKSIKQNFN